MLIVKPVTFRASYKELKWENKNISKYNHNSIIHVCVRETEIFIFCQKDRESLSCWITWHPLVFGPLFAWKKKEQTIISIQN